MSDIWVKAESMARQAHLLLEAGEADGAAGRAYYAMFHAARAALELVDPDLLNAKTHSTIIRRFGQHVVKVGLLDPALGRMLSEAEGLRITADYDSAPFDRESARRVVESMDTFLAGTRALMGSMQP